MGKSRFGILKFICIMQLILAITNYNFLGIMISILTYYGLKKRNIYTIKLLMVPNIFETIVLLCCFVGYLLIVYSSLVYNDDLDAETNERKKKEILMNYIFFLSFILQALFQVFLTFSLYIIIKTYDELLCRNMNERMLFDDLTDDQRYIIEEFEPLPEYTPPVKLPSYETLESDITNKTVIDFNSFKIGNLEEEELENQNRSSEEPESDNDTIVQPETHENESVIITIDITNAIPHTIDSDLQLLPSPPPYSLYPTQN